MLTRISFPREALIIVQLLDSHLSLCILSAITLATCYFFDIALSVSILIALPFLITSILLGTLLGAILSPIAFLVEDIKRLSQIALSFWFLITPIVYQPTSNSSLANLTNYNPLSPLVIAARNAIANQTAIISTEAWFVVAATFCLSLSAWLCFRISAPIALERAGTVS